MTTKTFIWAAPCLAATLLATSAAAQTYTCTKDSDARTLEVLKPGVVGAACDLRYTTNNGATVRTPYHANNSQDFCAEKAQTILSDLNLAGYACVAQSANAAPPPSATIETASVDAAPAETPQPETPQPTPEPASASVVDETTVAAAPTEETAAPTVAAVETALQTTPDDETQEIARALAETANGATADEVEEAGASLAMAPVDSLPTPPSPSADELIEKLDAVIADDPAPAPQASAGPVALTSASTVVSDARAPKKSAAGRLVGASPQEAKIASPNAETRLAAAPPAPETPRGVTEPKVEGAAATADQPLQSSESIRRAPTVIKRVLAAQAAAWNEGDLDAFMAGYWKSPDLRFVSGTEVTGGWSKTLKRYRARYGTGAELGELSFKNLDVEMVTDDVAVVVGRFNLQRQEQLDTGVFTLVMRRFEGRWRIVHDHTVADAREASAEATR